MKICERCFVNAELNAVVKNLKEKGCCEICGTETYIYDTKKHNEIIDIIDDFLNMYLSAKEETPTPYRFNLENELINRWKIFSYSCSYKVKNIVKEIYAFSEESKERFDISLFDNEVYIPNMLDEEYLLEHAILRNNKWEDFTKSIKYENRYHAHILNEKPLDEFLEALVKEYDAKDTFYRARLSDQSGFSSKELGMPPPEKARAGRIGAEGIPCFYLANDKDTAIKEVRAGAFDYVTIAKFKLKHKIKVIDLRLLDDISPLSGVDPVALAVNRETLLKIKEEVEKPVRITENSLEYVPIQYICDYIRSKGYKGIIYGSTMSAKGYNLSAFSDDDFQYKGREIYYIEDLSVASKKIK